MKLFILSLLFLYVINAQKSCNEYATESPCVLDSGGACKWYPSFAQCRCVSTVKLDILFGVDTSGSIGWDGFQVQKQFIQNLIRQGINNGSRLGFKMFSTGINNSKTIQTWKPTALEDYTSGIYWTGGWTNTPELLTATLETFRTTKDPDRQQILLLITDGNPCLPEKLGGCPQSVCEYAFLLNSAGIRTIIIGVGDGLNPAYVGCLTQKPEDYIPVASFSDADFNAIMGSLSGVLCPISKNCKLTEVKGQRRPPAWSNRGDGRFTRYIEIYNTGVDFNLQELRLEGLVIMNAGPDVMVSQGQYLVFYDAADLPSTNGNTGAADPGPSIPSCHDCGTDCELGQTAGPACPVAGLGPSTPDYCFCRNAIYVACGNVNNSPDTTCPANANSLVDKTTGTPNTATNGCSVCNFDNTMTKTNWNVKVMDSGTSATVIDEVIYGDQGFWITTDDKFAYELISKSFDNDVGDNWAQSCSQFGTPGADPFAGCDNGCIANGCGGGNSCQTNGNCLCDRNTGYYPQCQQKKTGTGVICTKCLLVPGIGDCDVYWTKNGSDKEAAFNWTDIDYDGQFQFKLTYFKDATNTGTAYTNGETYKNVKGDYYPGNRSYGGFVQTCITAQVPLDNGGTSSEPYCSQKTMCEVYTATPTTSPTPAPTSSPTPDPTPLPTQSPTWACPRYWFTGGTSQEICGSHSCDSATKQAVGSCDRCSCAGKGENCCLLEPDFTVVYDQNRRHDERFACKMDVQLDNENHRDDEAKAGSSPGYLLNEDTHNFMVDISPDNYPSSCPMDIFWRLNFDCIDTGYTNTRRRLQSCDEATEATLSSAGLSIDVTHGMLKVWGENDIANATIEFTVTRAECSADAGNTTRRRLAGGKKSCDLFNNVAIFGNLEIVNATSYECQPDCEDGRIYPMRIPVWYNWAAAFVAPPSQEKELPAWLWWMIAALVIFLALLAFLLYRYWWKNKKTGAALGSVQADLDAAVIEAEMGFGNDLGKDGVGFNPLATGFNPNAPAGPAGPNAPPQGHGSGPNFIRPNVEKPVFKEQYGPQMGNMGGGGNYMGGGGGGNLR